MPFHIAAGAAVLAKSEPRPSAPNPEPLREGTEEAQRARNLLSLYRLFLSLALRVVVEDQTLDLREHL